MNQTIKTRHEIALRGDPGELNLVAGTSLNGAGPAIHAGDRVPVSILLEKLAAVGSMTELADGLGWSMEQIQEALHFAAARLKRDEIHSAKSSNVIPPWPGNETEVELLAALKAMG
jgi:uncharacterized protein (DUF433 family)